MKNKGTLFPLSALDHNIFNKTSGIMIEHLHIFPFARTTPIHRPYDLDTYPNYWHMPARVSDNGEEYKSSDKSLFKSTAYIENRLPLK